MGEYVKETYRKSGVEDEAPVEQPKDLSNTELGDDIDSLLGEIDDILEENAEEFVKGYIQQGGQ